MRENGEVTLLDVRRVIGKMDNKRRQDMLDSIICEMFDDFYDDNDHRMESLIEIIENISGLDNLECLLYT